MIAVDGLPRLLHDRRRLHPVGQGAGHPGGARPRLGRRLAGGLGAHHHRHRPDPVRPAVRAVPEPGARVDARLRHRFLPGPPRRGDRLRAPRIRRRPGGADHHLRQAAGPRRGARRRPRAGAAVRPGEQGLRADPEQPGQAGDAAAGDRRRAAAAGDARRRRGGAPPDGDRPAAGGAVSPRQHPCRRRGDRRPAAVRAGAAVSRPEERHAGVAIQHEVRRAGRAGEVRLPGPDHADHPAARRADAGRLGVAVDLATLPLDDARTYEMLARGDTAGVFQFEGAGMRDVLRQMRPTGSRT